MGGTLAFSLQKISNGQIYDGATTMYPSLLHGFCRGEVEFSGRSSTYFGFVAEGPVQLLRAKSVHFELTAGMYFCVPGEFSLQGGGSAVVFERIGYRGMFTVGGPIEDTGRLCYVDNCSTSQLIPPVRLGDPTLQLLCFPPGVDQSMHIHPTLRYGYVYSGSGFNKSSDGQRAPVSSGDVFYVPERLVHGFVSNPEGMVVIAFHPDSDVGPTDQMHPMLSRTYLLKK